MKHYQYSIWRQLNNPSADRNALLKDWQLAEENAHNEIEKLRPLLPSELYYSLSTHRFHDLVIEQWTSESPNSLRWKFKQDVSSETENITLSFSNVVALSLTFDAAATFGMAATSIFEWGYAEISQVIPEYLCLRVLFSSGAEVAVTFKALTISSE